MKRRKRFTAADDSVSTCRQPDRTLVLVAKMVCRRTGLRGHLHRGQGLIGSAIVAHLRSPPCSGAVCRWPRGVSWPWPASLALFAAPPRCSESGRGGAARNSAGCGRGTAERHKKQLLLWPIGGGLTDTSQLPPRFRGGPYLPFATAFRGFIRVQWPLLLCTPARGTDWVRLRYFAADPVLGRLVAASRWWVNRHRDA